MMVADNFNGYHPMIMSSLLGRVLRAGGMVVPRVSTLIFLFRFCLIKYTFKNIHHMH